MRFKDFKDFTAEDQEVLEQLFEFFLYWCHKVGGFPVIIDRVEDFILMTNNQEFIDGYYDWRKKCLPMKIDIDAAFSAIATAQQMIASSLSEATNLLEIERKLKQFRKNDRN